MHYFKSLLLGLFFLISSTSAFSQSINKDSLKLLDFLSLKERIFQTQKDTLRCQLYIDAYIYNAKTLNNTNEIARGYYYKTLITSSTQVKETYYDSIISITKDVKNSNYPSIVNLDKGVNFYNKRKFKDALDSYLLALELNNGDRKSNLDFLINMNIALLKSRIGFNNEALELYRKCWIYALNQDFKTVDPKKYLSLMGFLAHSFRKEHSLDSASYYNNKGLTESLRLKDDSQYYHFVLNDGIINFYQNNIERSKDSLEKGLNFMITNNNLPNMAVGNYYLGKVMSNLGHKEKAIHYFKKVDTVFQLNKDILPETREAYHYLTNYYKGKGDLLNELNYIEKLIVVDSVLNDNYKFLSKNISRKYDMPKLLEQKETIINKLNDKNSLYTNYLYWILIIAILAISFGFYQYYRKLIFSKRFEELVNNNSIPNNTIEKGKLNISKDIVSHVVKGLEVFEDKKDYLLSEINLTNLAKQLNTNSNYLSKIINHYQNKNFSSYVNDLRVDYAFTKLKSDKKFRKYTIKAIAQEVGFKNSESFSKAFYKRYKIYPSFYIKSLDGFLKDNVK